MAVPSGAEATTYAQTVKQFESRVVLAVSYPIWTAQVTDTFGGSSIDNNLWVTSIVQPNVSGGECNLRVYGNAPFEFLYSRPKWFPTVEDLGFVVTIVVKFPDATPGYACSFQLFGLEAGRGKTSDPLRVVKVGDSNLGGTIDSYPFFDSSQEVGDLFVQSSLFTPYEARNNGIGSPEADHTYTFEWAPTGGQDGGGEITIFVDGVLYIQYDNENASVSVETELGRVANPNCVRPYGIMFQYVGEFLDQVADPSGTQGGVGVPQVGVNQLEIASVTVDELTPRAMGYLTVTAQPGNTETVTIDGKVYTFQTTLTNVNGNVHIGETLRGSMQNLAAAIKLDNSGEFFTGAGSAYAAAMTLHGTVTAESRQLGGDALTEGLRPVAKTAGTGGNSITTTETLANGSWGGATLSGGAAGEGFETRAWPGWTSANDGGALDTAAIGERFDLDGETWAILPNVETWNTELGRDRRTDTFMVRLVGADPDDPDTAQNIFQADRFLGRPILIDTRVLREDDTATAWKRQICGIVENVQVRVDDGKVIVILSGRDRPSVKLDTETTRSYISSTLTDAATRTVNADFTMSQVFADIVDVSDIGWDGDELGATDVSIPTELGGPPQALVAGPNLLAAFTQIADEHGLEVWRRYTTSGTGRYGELVIGRWILGPEHGIVSDEYAAVTSYSLFGQGSAGVNNIQTIILIEGHDAAVGTVTVHFDAGVFPSGNVITGGGELGPADYPLVPYPPHARELRMSYSGAWFTPFTPTITGLEDQFGNIHQGGPGVARFRRENSARRVVHVTLIDHDWVEVTDPIDIDDPDHTGITDSELWVVNGLNKRFKDGSLESRLELFTSDIISAIVRGT